MVILVLASTKPGLEPFQDPGVAQHHLQPRGSHLEGWNFFLVPKYHSYNILHHFPPPLSVPTCFFPFLRSKMTKNELYQSRAVFYVTAYTNTNTKLSLVVYDFANCKFHLYLNEKSSNITFSCQKSHFQSFLTIKTKKKRVETDTGGPDSWCKML